MKKLTESEKRNNELMDLLRSKNLTGDISNVRTIEDKTKQEKRLYIELGSIEGYFVVYEYNGLVTNFRIHIDTIAMSVFNVLFETYM